MAATVRPVPAGRGRWRLTLHDRQFADTRWSVTQIAELSTARSRRLDQSWNSPATLTFTMDGRDPAAALIAELQTDVIAWRWDDSPGAAYYQGLGCDVQMFRGVVAQSEDEVSEDTHTVIFTCHDYLAMLGRRFNSLPISYTQQDQDTMVADFVYRVSNIGAANGQAFRPGSYLPLVVALVNPDGSARTALSNALGAPLRDRVYPAASYFDQMLDDLAKVIGGFDYDLLPSQTAANQGIGPGGTYQRDYLRVFYPYQGVQRFDVPLVYGATVTSFTRSVSSGDYANLWRVTGQAPAGSPDGTPPMFSEAWNADTNNVTITPIGLWMNADNAADVSIQSTLDQKAQGDLAWSGVIADGVSPASYTLGLRPGAYSYGRPNMGDICPLVITTGRLNINDNIRVLGIGYSIGDDGQEDVELTVGRPTRTLTQLLTQADRDTDALTRRTI